MNFEDYQKQRSAKFLAEHELDEDSLERLIENKLHRARVYYDALQRQEEEVVDFD